MITLNEARQLVEQPSGARCPGGYLLQRRGLCGRTGNRCVESCAFAYRGRLDFLAQKAMGGKP